MFSFYLNVTFYRNTIDPKLSIAETKITQIGLNGTFLNIIELNIKLKINTGAKISRYGIPDSVEEPSFVSILVKVPPSLTFKNTVISPDLDKSSTAFMLN